jgi:hypothetical protein
LGARLSMKDPAMTFKMPPIERGQGLLLAHCAVVADERRSAYSRLEEEVGGPLARLLVSALSGHHQGRRGSSSP